MTAPKRLWLYSDGEALSEPIRSDEQLPTEYILRTEAYPPELLGKMKYSVISGNPSIVLNTMRSLLAHITEIDG